MRTAIEAVFDAIVTEGWANYSDGDVEAPTGHFAAVTNAPAELSELRAAFSDVLTTYGTVTDADLTGHFLVVTDNQGFVTVVRCPNSRALQAAFAASQSAYNVWMEA